VTRTSAAAKKEPDVSTGEPELPDGREARRTHPTAQRILAAARLILTERGYQALTTQAIATESGVNKAGVWYYFGGKEQLVLALFEEVAVTGSHHFGTLPARGATLEERVDLIVGSARQVQERVRRFAAFYELLPEASRDAQLRERLMTYYEGWYAWAGEVLDTGENGAQTGTVGQFASILLDGIFLQMVVAARGFDLEVALTNARESLLHLARRERIGPA
jgi:AcrR family transcriptional regulator